MRLRLVRLFAVVIALVVPLQGMAAVVAGQCMAFGHHEDATGHDSHGQASDGHGAHDHGSHSHADEDHAQVAADESDSNGTHCGPCTACCASASITGPVGVFIPSSTSSTAYVFSQYPPIGVQPNGLYRPPLAL